MKRPILIAGCGDLGLRVGASMAAAGARVIGIRRSPVKNRSIDWHLADLDAAENREPWPRSGGVFYFAPPPPSGLEDTRLSRFLARVTVAPKRFVLVSTAGVYGDRRGEWVTEESEVDPATDRARRRLLAENLATNWCEDRGVEMVILRVSGIYGPGRWPLDRLKSGMVVLDSAIAPYSNRIHIEDLTSIAIDLMDPARAGGVYNVSDGRPSSLTDYFVSVAASFGLPRPREVGLAEARELMSPAMLSYLSESRRLSNRKLLAETGLRLRYPDLRSALDEVEASRDSRS